MLGEVTIFELKFAFECGQMRKGHGFVGSLFLNSSFYTDDTSDTKKVNVPYSNAMKQKNFKINHVQAKQSRSTVRMCEFLVLCTVHV